MLSKNDYDLLVLYREERPCPEDEAGQERFDRFFADGWVRSTRYETLRSGGVVAPLNQSHFSISALGEDLLQEFEKAQRSAKWAEVRYWLTTSIAAAAFIKSFFG